MSPLQRITTLRKNSGKEIVENDSINNQNVSSSQNSTTAFIPVTVEVPRFISTATSSPVCLSQAPQSLTSPLKERPRCLKEQDRHVSTTLFLASTPETPLRNAVSLEDEDMDATVLLETLQEQISAAFDESSKLLHHPLSTVHDEGLLQARCPIIPPSVARSIPPAYAKELIRFVRKELASCSRFKLEEEYYAAEKASRDESVTEVSQQLEKLEQDISYMSSQSSMYLERKQSLFKKSDAAKSSHIHEIATLRGARERAEHKRKLVDIEMQRLKRMKKKK